MCDYTAYDAGYHDGKAVNEPRANASGDYWTGYKDGLRTMAYEQGRDAQNPGINPQADPSSLTSEPQGKDKKSEIGS